MTEHPRISLADREAVLELLEDAPDEIAEHFELVKEGLKHIPWLAEEAIDWEGGDKNRALALTPQIFTLWWLEEYYVIKCGSVDAATKELLALAVASRMGCRSCVPYHAGAARFEGADDNIVDVVQRFDDLKEELPESLRVLLDVGVKSVYDPNDVSESDIERVRALGYSDAEIVELVVCAQVSFKNAALNRIFALNQ